MRNPICVAGMKINRLTLIQTQLVRCRNKKSPKGYGFRKGWICKCDCGALTVILEYVLVRSISCMDCHRARRLTGTLSRTHGLRSSTEYSAWAHMIQRCTNPNIETFPLYGGRGIAVCARWLDSFEAFYADMGAKPTASHSLDRWPDMNGNYEPGNCRWATWVEQANNRRVRKTAVWVLLRGARVTLTDVAKEFGLSYGVAWKRLKRGTLGGVDVCV